jgi:hypothetical protein
MEDFDWGSWSKTRPYTIEALSRFNAIEVDPFTALLAGAISSQFRFSPHGDQNIGNAFAGLQTPQRHPVIGLGYTEAHIVPVLLRSNEGSNFLAICGALAEYYPTDTIASVFVALAKRANVPREMTPSKSQWFCLIDTCAGVLSASPFGILLAQTSRVHEATISTHAEEIADGLLMLNARTAGNLTGDAPFLSAIGQWLFDVRPIVETPRGRGPEDENKLQPTVKGQEADPMGVPTAGRVQWDVVFRTCFGQAWLDLNKDTLAAIIGAASGMVHHYLTKSGRDPRTFFLQHEVGIKQMAGFGMNETIIAWFEELRRLAPNIVRFYRKEWDDTGEKMPKAYDKAVKSIENDCQCSTCGSGYSKICLVSLAECIVALGVFVARMVVVPNLYMKVNGVQQFYRGCYEDRKDRRKRPDYVASDLTGLAEDLPTPFRMLEEACVLFTGSKPENMPRNQLSIARNGLYLLITYLKFNPDDAPESRPAASVQIETGGFSYHGRFLKHNFWDPGPSNIPIETGFDNVHKRAKEIVQIMKLEGQHTLISQVRRDPADEKKAEELGWDVIRNNNIGEDS